MNASTTLSSSACAGSSSCCCFCCRCCCKGSSGSAGVCLALSSGEPSSFIVCSSRLMCSRWGSVSSPRSSMTFPSAKSSVHRTCCHPNPTKSASAGPHPSVTAHSPRPGITRVTLTISKGLPTRSGRTVVAASLGSRSGSCSRPLTLTPDSVVRNGAPRGTRLAGTAS